MNLIKLNLKKLNLMKSIASILVAFTCLGSTSALAAGGWASIAYNQNTGTWGEAHGFNDLADAESAAQNSCGAGCVIVAWVHNGFIALATGDNGWGVSDGRANAQNAVNVAVNQCASVTTNCAWRVWSSGIDQ